MPSATSPYPPCPIRLAACLALCAAALPAAGSVFAAQMIIAEEEQPEVPVAESGGPWHEARSEHFVLRGDVAPDALERGALDLERLREVIAEIAGSEDAVLDHPTFVYLFSSERAFEPYRLPGSGGTGTGYVLPEDDASYAATANPQITRQVYRQYVHELLHRQHPDMPVWLRHGLAEYYSTFEADAHEARIGLPDEGRLRSSGMTAGRTLPLAELLALQAPPAGDDPLDDSLFQTRSWILVHYLMGGDTAHRRLIGNYVRQTAGGEDPVAAFRSAFGVDDLEAFDETLEKYRGNASFTFLRVPLTSRASASGDAVTVRRLSEAETALAQGELLLRLGPSHQDAAAARLRRAVALDDGSGPAWAGLARLAAARGDGAEALDLYRQAAARMPDDFGVQLGLGQALLGVLGGRRASDDASRAALADAKGSLRRATELRPDSGEAWAGLGQAGVLAAEPDPEAIPALERAVGLLPADRTDVLYNLLLARARAGDGAGVDEAALALREAGADDDLLGRAREVRLQLVLQEAHALATAGRLDDAVALFAVVRAESTRPEIARQADELLERVARAEEHNRFAERYSSAVTLYRAGDFEAAAAAVETMMATAAPGRQMDTLRQLRARIALDSGEP